MSLCVIRFLKKLHNGFFDLLKCHLHLKHRKIPIWLMKQGAHNGDYFLPRSNQRRKNPKNGVCSFQPHLSWLSKSEALASIHADHDLTRK